MHRAAGREYIGPQLDTQGPWHGDARLQPRDAGLQPGCMGVRAAPAAVRAASLRTRAAGRCACAAARSRRRAAQSAAAHPPASPAPRTAAATHSMHAPRTALLRTVHHAICAMRIHAYATHVRCTAKRCTGHAMHRTCMPSSRFWYSSAKTPHCASSSRLSRSTDCTRTHIHIHTHALTTAH